MSTEWVMLSDKVYEFQKGIRPLFLCTVSREVAPLLMRRLERADIAYHLEEISSVSPRVNLFFGKELCIAIISEMVRGRSLTMLSPEEDFILGTLLGYDTCQQCERYQRRKQSARQVVAS